MVCFEVCVGVGFWCLVELVVFLVALHRIFLGFGWRFVVPSLCF